MEYAVQCSSRAVASDRHVSWLRRLPALTTPPACPLAMLMSRVCAGGCLRSSPDRRERMPCSAWPLLVSTGGVLFYSFLDALQI